MSGAFLLM